VSVTTTTKIAGRRVSRDEAGQIATKIATLLEKVDSYGTASIDVSMTAQWRRYGSSAADKVDATVRIVTG
jgi:hypothetical protein